MIARRKSTLLVPAALMVACVGLGLIVVLELLAAPNTRVLNTASSEPVSAQTTRSEAKFSIPPPETFAAIVDRPIFSRSRSPFSGDEVPDLEIGSDLNIVLTGIITSSEQMIALVAPKGSTKFVQLRRGDRFQGWILESIESDRVTFSRNGEKAQIELSYVQPPPRRTKPRATSGRTRPAKAPPTKTPQRKKVGSNP